MAQFERYGKVSAEILERTVFPYLGAKRKEVLVGPGHGLDNAVIDLGSNKVLIVTTDVMWCEPRKFGVEDAAWAAWNIMGSDITTSGNAPAYIVVDFTLPIDAKEEDLETICKTFHNEALKYGAAVVTGHSSPYYTCDYPTIGTMTMMAVCDHDKYITPQMAVPGDIVIMTKGAPITPAACMVRYFPKTIKKELGGDIYNEAWNMFHLSSSMQDALLASSIGMRDNGVTAMHDATEGGILNAFIEVAIASNNGIFINLDDIVIPPASKVICEYFKIDPFNACSLGTLVLTCKPSKVGCVLDILKENSIKAYIVGEVKPLDQGCQFLLDGKVQTINAPRHDTFWPALFTSVEKGLK